MDRAPRLLVAHGPPIRTERSDPMVISLRPEHLKRYGDLARLMIRYGRSDLVKQARLDEALAEGPESEEPAGSAESLAEDLERMGPTYIKLGQLLSSRPDLLPPPYIESLSRLQDRIEPFPFDEVQHIVNEELGVRLSKAYLDFDPVPVAAASLGQVHCATLHDGREVVVKVQRPGIRNQIAGDISVLEELAEFLDKHTDIGHRVAVGDVLAQFTLPGRLNQLMDTVAGRDYEELRGTTGNYGELRGTTGSYEELRGTTGNYGELRGTTGNYGELRGTTRDYGDGEDE